MNLHETADFFEKLWFERRGLSTAIVIATAGVFSILMSHVGVLWSVAWALAIDIAIAIIWWWSQRPPVTNVNKIGFLISISCTDDSESQKLQEDFIQPLRELIKSGRAGNVFQILEMPQHIASNIKDAEQAQALRIKCRAHFMIYGRVRLREINGKETHVIDLESCVAHTPIPHNISQTFAQEFTELMPRKLHLAKENDLLAFQFTSEWTDVVARYIIAFASAVSGDLDYAEKLYLDVKDRLHNKDTKFPIYIKLKERVPLRISEIYLSRAMGAYRKWTEGKDNNYLLQAEKYLEYLAPEYQDTKEALNLRAILAFILREDIDEAIALIKKIKGRGHPQWHLNLAFLLGYKGELKNAIRHYRLAAGLADIQPEMLAQIEDFIVCILEKKPDKHQLYYCLGFFNWKIKGDLARAVKDFKSFIENATAPEMESERKLSLIWVEEIRAQLAIAK